MNGDSVITLHTHALGGILPGPGQLVFESRRYIDPEGPEHIIELFKSQITYDIYGKNVRILNGIST